jgi:hypothetical protein
LPSKKAKYLQPEKYISALKKEAMPRLHREVSVVSKVSLTA